MQLPCHLLTDTTKEAAVTPVWYYSGDLSFHFSRVKSQKWNCWVHGTSLDSVRKGSREASPPPHPVSERRTPGGPGSCQHPQGQLCEF